MVRHNNVLPNVHLNKDWQGRVKTWFDQAGRKRRRRQNRLAKARLVGPK
jgi:large subunit ribosomal protein L13e